MSTFVDIEFDIDEKKLSDKKPVEKPIETPIETPLKKLTRKEKVANRKRKNEDDERKIVANISYILTGLVDFTETIKTFIDKDYMFKTDGIICLGFIKNYSNSVDTISFLQNIKTCNFSSVA